METCHTLSQWKVIESSSQHLTVFKNDYDKAQQLNQPFKWIKSPV